MPSNRSGLGGFSGSKELTPSQGELDLRVEIEKEVHGINMGVLSDGTPFLTQRGLARLCGVENRHIATIGQDWNDTIQKGRITKIKSLLSRRGIVLDMPYKEIKEANRIIHAYSDVACLAILEYFAFEADILNQEQARDNFRLLAGKALQDFIYTQVGYNPAGAIPIAWQQFHDRVTLVSNKIPNGYFGIFKEIADLIVTMIRGGAPIGAEFVPDISVGTHWSNHWKAAKLAEKYGDRIKYLHEYPDYFPQSASNPQKPFCYPDAALPEFRRWMREDYLKGGKFANYIGKKESEGVLPPSFSQIALKAIGTDDPDQTT
ncbi:hypothetical protein [Methylobacterium variabile]|jgi:hypothetical protein|uniref:hypothetical protein n=1 Tax=Methylobacterium variabile TaxID=298794 RepID=UPI0009FA560D|nr:hypothetical protein [Methylobacterium variabile]